MLRNSHTICILFLSQPKGTKERKYIEEKLHKVISNNIEISLLIFVIMGNSKPILLTHSEQSRNFYFNASRAITNFCTSLVPSPMVHNFASR